MSLAATARRETRIRALTPVQARRVLNFMAGWAPRAADIALDDEDALRCRECGEDTPWHTAQCTLRPGAEPVAVPVAIAEIDRISREWPDGVHTCEELQRLEPGRRSCTCGRCPAAAAVPGDAS